MIPLLIGALLSLISFATDPVDLVVHEWGTLTSMQGSDGVALEGLQHEEEALPSFVHDFYGDSTAVDFGFRRSKGLCGSVRGVTVKLETPVTYFYAPHSMFVRARVGFEHGILSQWYPAASSFGVDGVDGSACGVGEFYDLAAVGRGWLEWQAELLAPDDGLDRVPQVGSADPWQYARAPHSNALRVHAAATQRTAAHDEVEQYLFYRGLGRCELPIRVRTSAGTRLEITNTSTVPSDVLRHLFVLHVRDGRGEFSYVPAVEAQKSVALVRPLDADAQSVDAMVTKLKPALARALVEVGLFEAEAQAMVDTWEVSYFHTEGLRVLYILPRRFTDAILPLSIEPLPRTMVRVLVGRLECLTPEVEDEVESVLLQLAVGNGGDGGNGGNDADGSAKQAARSRLDRFQRFLEPHLRRALARASDPRVAQTARTWLDEPR